MKQLQSNFYPNETIKKQTENFPDNKHKTRPIKHEFDVKDHFINYSGQNPNGKPHETGSLPKKMKVKAVKLFTVHQNILYLLDVKRSPSERANATIIH